MAEKNSSKGQFLFFLDEPTAWTGNVRRLRLVGWCVAKEGEPIVAIRAQVRGKNFTGRFKIARPDVSAHLGLSTPSHCGFAIDLEVPFGRSRLEIFVARADQTWRKVFAREITGPFRRSAAERATRTAKNGQENLVANSRFSFWIDEPRAWEKPIRHLRLSGWCVASTGSPVQEIRARVRRKIYPAKYGILRPDVAATIEEKEAAMRSGFSLDLIAPWGASTLTLEARGETGEWEKFFSRRVRGPVFWTRAGRFEDVGNYGDWIYLHERLTSADKAKIRRQIRGFARQPLISILSPVYESNPVWLERAVASVRRQFYPNWELCLVDDASRSPHVWPLLQRLARRDPRIKIFRRETNGHICAASNDALALATGEFVALLDHDDELAPAALYFVALALNRQADLQLIYTDEDKLDPEGRRCDPYFKSDWNPDLLTSQNYISHLSVFPTDLVRKVGGFRPGYEGSQDYDLILRCVEKIAPSQIHHIPRVLYHWRITAESTATSASAKPYARVAAIQAVQDYINRGLTSGRVERAYAEYLHVHYDLPAARPLVSIVIATRDRLSLLRQCLESLRAKTDYENFEIILIDNESSEPETLSYLSELTRLPQIEVVRVPGEFNFSRLNNLGVARARGEFIALLNNDLEVMNRGWLGEMLSHAARPGVGAVGARLWYPNGKLQHGGVLLGVGGIANHAHRLVRLEHGYFARAKLTQDFSAVTGACLVLRKKIFEGVGGFDEEKLPVSFNDVDLCLRLREQGWLMVWTPQAELIHHESASRGYEDTAAKQQRLTSEVVFMQKRWGHLIEADPYYNPNLSLSIDQQFKLAFPPRVGKPWEEAR